MALSIFLLLTVCSSLAGTRNFMPPDEILYLSSGENIIQPQISALSQKNASNKFEGGKGILTFEKVLSKVGVSAFKKCYSPVSYILPESVSVIYKKALFRRSSLSSFSLPFFLKSIQSQALSDCGAPRTVILLSSIKKNESSAFGDCVSLTQVNIKASVPPELGSKREFHYFTSILVSITAQEQHKVAVNWNRYSDKIKSIGL